ncbi:Sporulation initiation inhibitor protein Soj [Pseudomonas syringae pv. actinidiae]|uniref:Chromosome (Plasmid) partitioning protein ParA n=2 Tax=Pseudomonas syringae TaxID=317 RepID=A0A286JZY8_PSESF|nr:Chromosome (plasmid) partitioning protein ParA [Pseudomonas syringae pv. actinidiae]OSO70528.1 Sporulation initiation inhibitor protein Soj [Pseudomonas syringae pv. actinidiae]
MFLPPTEGHQMNATEESPLELQSFVDFAGLTFSPQFAAECFGLTTRRLKDIEEENGIEIRRVPRGSSTARVYGLADLFAIAALRRRLGHSKGLSRQMVVSIFVPKGGTNKTTTAVNLALSAQFAGLKTLIIDNDPQGDTSSMLGYDPDLGPEDLTEMGIPQDRLVDGHLGNLVSPLLRMRAFDPKTLDEVIKKPFGDDGIHLIPADSYIEDLGVALDASNNPDMWYARWIEQAKSGEIPGCDLSSYDLIIFDNAPAGSRLTKNSVAASDLLLCPIRMDKFSFRALLRLNDWCARFAREYGYAPKMLAIPTMFIRNRPSLINNLFRLNELFPGRVTEEKIYLSEEYTKSLDEGIPLLLWKGATFKSLGPIRDVHREILNRMREIASA